MRLITILKFQSYVEDDLLIINEILLYGYQYFLQIDNVSFTYSWISTSYFASLQILLFEILTILGDLKFLLPEILVKKILKWWNDNSNNNCFCSIIKVTITQSGEKV